MDMRFYWSRDGVKQKHFEVFWKPGMSNLGEFFTKHNSEEHHKGVRPIYLHCRNVGQASARVC